MDTFQLLDNSVGTFTLEKQLALIHSDSSEIIISEDSQNPLYVIKHDLDYEVNIFLNILNFIAQCEQVQLPIAHLTPAPFFHKTGDYHIQFKDQWESLIQKIQPALSYSFSTRYAYSEEIKAWICVRDQFSESDLIALSHWSITHLHQREQITQYLELLHQFIQLLIQHIQSASYKKKIRDRQASKSKNKKACIELMNHLIAKFATILVVRIDFSLKRDPETLLKNAASLVSPNSQHDLNALKNFMTKFKNNWRNKKILKDIEGYIFQYEYSHLTGFHIHSYFFFAESKHQEDISIGQFIANYWKKITHNQGSCFICNMKKNQYRYCGIGKIHYSDLEKQSYLIQTFDYICKADQFFIFSELKNMKRFQRSQLPQPKAKAGRTRKLTSAQQHTTY